MEEFFEKLKKKLSVDNILDLMKDGKLKEDIKQTLTATTNLNEKHKYEDEMVSEAPKTITIEAKKPIIVESVQPKAEEDQTTVKLDESKKNADEVKEIPQKSLEPDVQTGEVFNIKKTEEPSNLLKDADESMSDKSAHDTSESNKSNLNILAKPIASQSKTEQIESRQFEESFNWT